MVMVRVRVRTMAWIRVLARVKVRAWPLFMAR